MNLFKKEETNIDIDLKIANQIRCLALDIINNRGKGNDGVTLSSGGIFYTLFSKHLNINTQDSNYLNQDRLIITTKNMEPLLQATMYMAGFPCTIDDLKENNLNESIKLTSENFASSVGMALAEEYQRNYFKSKNIDLINHYTYVIVSDEDLMEGISYEAASIAGNLKLNKLIVIHDNNGYTLDGNIDLTFDENVIERFKALGWNTVEVNNGEDIIGIDKAISFAKDSDKPTYISVKTTLGKFSKYENSSLINNHILTNEDISEIKNKLELRDVSFSVSSELMETFQEEINNRVLNSYEEFNKKVETIEDEYLTKLLNNDLTINLGEIIDITDVDTITNYGHKVLNSIDNVMFMSLSTSFENSKTYLDEKGDFSSKNRLGQNVYCGSRKMISPFISTGLTLSGIRNVVASHISAIDDMISSIRMSGNMNIPNIYIFTHDSIVKENDEIIYPNLEQLDILTTLKNVEVFRPNDMNEVIGTFKTVLGKVDGPSVVILSQDEVNTKIGTSINDTSLGGYIVKEEEGIPCLNLIASGKDLDIAIELEQHLLTKGIFTRVISMPSFNRFDIQDDEYKNKVIDKNEKTFVIPSSHGYNYLKYTTDYSYLLNIDTPDFNVDTFERKIEEKL